VSVQPAVRQATQAEQLAVEHQAAQGALTDATLAAILALWSSADENDWLGSWFRDGLGQRVYVLLSIAQESVASEAQAFVETSLAMLGASAEIPALVPHQFAGIASDGRNLESLLAGAPIQALMRTRRGDAAAVARQAGRAFLQSVVQTQIPDAGRAADQVAIATAEPVDPRTLGIKRPGRKSSYKRTQYGYVRVLNPPSCGRCIVLAGRFYRWNEGFPRHVNCDCRHIPAIEAVDDDLVTNPYTYFKSLDAEQQNEAFGKANAEAIRSGADMSQVVNATRRGGVYTADDGRRYTKVGTTKRGYYGRNADKVLRPTPWQILHDARGNKDEARRQLLRFGYILS
jgi:hypothetical protein